MNKDRATRIRSEVTSLDYEQEALESLARSWEVRDKECAKLAVADAQVWATLHLARCVKLAN